MSQSERIADKLDRPRTRQALHNWREGEEDENKSRRSVGDHPSSHPEHIKKCYICYSEAERETTTRKKRQRQSCPNPTATTVTEINQQPSTSDKSSVEFQSSPGDIPDVIERPDVRLTESSATESKKGITKYFLDKTPGLIGAVSLSSALDHSNTDIKGNKVPEENKLQFVHTDIGSDATQESKSVTKLDTLYTDIALSPDSPHIESESVIAAHRSEYITDTTGLSDIDSVDFLKPILTPTLSPPIYFQDIKGKSATYTDDKSSPHSLSLVAVATHPTATLATTAKSQHSLSAKPPTAVPPPAATPSKAVNNIPLPSSHPSAHIPQTRTMTSTGPITRLKSQGLGVVEGQHRQISAANIDEATLDQCFHVQPKWHYIKSTHDDTSQWLESASFESILTELLYFAHDQGTIQQKEIEGQFEKEVERAMESIEKLECLDAFCKTFIHDNRFRPAGKVILAGSGKNEKHNRLFRMINADLQNLQRQHRILSMVCRGTADHEVHTQAQRENLRKLVEDLVTIVHPGDRGTYSEVYKVVAENAVFDQRNAIPQLTSLKLVSHPDIVVPFGGPIMAGGELIRSDALEHKIRAKLPSLLIKMHFSDNVNDQKWPDLSRADDSGIGTLDDTTILDDSTTGSGKARMKDKVSEDKSKTPSSAGKSSSKRKHDESPAIQSKRQRENLYTRDSQPPDAHVINEIYGEHVSQLICSLTSSPMGYIKHSKYSVPAADERDGTACVSVLGMIVSGEDVYLTKMDASHDYLDSMVESFRMDQLSFSCLANPLNLYKGTHLKALLMFLRYICLNFPRTTYFLSD